MVTVDWSNERTQLIAGAVAGLALGIAIAAVLDVLTKPPCNCHEQHEPNAGEPSIEHVPETWIEADAAARAELLDEQPSADG